MCVTIDFVEGLASPAVKMNRIYLHSTHVEILNNALAWVWLHALCSMMLFGMGLVGVGFGRLTQPRKNAMYVDSLDST